MFATTVVGPVPIPSAARLQPVDGATQQADRQKGNGVNGAEDPAGSAARSEAEPTRQASDAERAKRATAGEAPAKPNGEALSEAELRQVAQMKHTDAEVRRHELAHQVAGGAYTGAPSYQYERGPDGNRYAVAGQVPIDYGPLQGDPHATIGKMQQVISAALAPGDPSPKDHQVAARARQYMLAARLELSQLQSEMDSARQNGAPQNSTLASRPSLSQYDIIARAVNMGTQGWS
ncbi:MAG TPA: putative metalloprotease CJM1_0395 family protein [Halomonas sp.]|nr:putative metalloprotease CJM1_0395 family protein [Halomonas sp.]